MTETNLIYCFGSSKSGQTTLHCDVNVPHHISSYNARHIFASTNLSGYLSDNGSLLAWGTFDCGSGVNLFSQPQLFGQKISRVDAFQTSIYIETFDGSVQKLGYQDSLYISGSVKHIFAQFDQFCYLTKDNQTYLNTDKGFELLPLATDEYTIYVRFPQFGPLILTNNRKLYLYSKNKLNLISEAVITIAATHSRGFYLSYDGRIYEIFGNDSSQKIQITGIIGTPISLFAGGAHVGCVTYEGDCWTWGTGTSGQLGQGSFTNSPFPKPIILEKDIKVIEATAGEAQTIILTTMAKNFVPKMPKEMLQSQYGRIAQMKTLLPAAALPLEIDAKF